MGPPAVPAGLNGSYITPSTSTLFGTPYCDWFIPPENCTLSTCCYDQAIFAYRPTLAGNGIYLVLLGLLLFGHLFLGIRYKTAGFTIGMVCGLVLEVCGYGGRIWLNINPFEFNAFLL